MQRKNSTVSWADIFYEGKEGRRRIWRRFATICEVPACTKNIMRMRMFLQTKLAVAGGVKAGTIQQWANYFHAWNWDRNGEHLSLLFFSQLRIKWKARVLMGYKKKHIPNDSKVLNFFNTPCKKKIHNLLTKSNNMNARRRVQEKNVQLVSMIYFIVKISQCKNLTY